MLTYLWDFGNISMHKIYSELKFTRNTVQHSNGIISIRVYLPIQYLQEELGGGDEEGKIY